MARKKENENMSNRHAGVDIGTGTLYSGISSGDTKGEIELVSMRNMFTPISIDDIGYNNIINSKMEFVELRDNDGELENAFIIGEDAYKFGIIYNQDPKRPMKDGIISPEDVDSLDVITLMLERMIGRTENGICTYSIPAPPVDREIASTLYHEKIFGKIFKSLGYDAKPLNEAMAVVYSEAAKTEFSAIACSFGSGMVNVCYSYRGVPAITFSVCRGGDWIDKNVSENTGTSISRANAIKEKTDLLNPDGKNRKEKRVTEAVSFYYKELIEYVLMHLVKEFEKNSDGLSIIEEIPMIISGGTSRATGFMDIFKEVFNTKFADNFPYEISEIVQAKDPMAAVALGCLTHSLWETKK